MITIIKTGRSIVVNFGDYAESQDSISNGYDETDVVEVKRVFGDQYCRVFMRDAMGVNLWDVTRDQSYKGDDRFIISQINGLSLNSNEALFDALNGLRG